MTTTTTPPVPTDPDPGADPVEPADVTVPPTPEPADVATPEPTADRDRPARRLEYAWRVQLVSLLGFVIIGCVRVSVHAPDGAAWLLLAALCLGALLVLSAPLVVKTRRARRRRRSRGGRDHASARDSGYGRRVPVSSVIAVGVAVLIVIAFDYGLANLGPTQIP